MKKLSASSYQLLACREEGFSLIEVMLAMVILAFAVVGVMGMYHWADYGLRLGANGIKALALAESRLEAKRAAPWDGLLADDLDFDGRPDLTMRDDGAGPDEKAGDGVYSAAADDGAIHLVWTVQTDRPGPLRPIRAITYRQVLLAGESRLGQGSREPIQVCQKLHLLRRRFQHRNAGSHAERDCAGPGQAQFRLHDRHTDAHILMLRDRVLLSRQSPLEMAQRLDRG